MLHPKTELKQVGPEIGVGVIASDFIPKGTIVYIKDPLEIGILDDDHRLQVPVIATVIERYSYREPNGARILSWDLAKYVNHSCEPNTISTGYGFEIACKDIEAGSEITDDYGLLNIERAMTCGCGSSQCRKRIRPDDLQRYHQAWDSLIRESLAHFQSVAQPLAGLMDDLTRYQLDRYLNTGRDYIPVDRLYFRNSAKPEQQAAV